MIDDAGEVFTSLDAARRGVQVLLSIAEDRAIQVDQRIVCATALVSLPIDTKLSMDLDGDTPQRGREESRADRAGPDHRVRDDAGDGDSRAPGGLRQPDDGGAA